MYFFIDIQYRTTDKASPGWKPLPTGLWTCRACMDHREHSKRQAIRHEQTETHRSAIAYRLSNQTFGLESDDPVAETESTVRMMLNDMASDLNRGNQFESAMPCQWESGENPHSQWDDSTPSYTDDFLDVSTPFDKAAISQALLEYLDGDLSDEQIDERSEHDHEEQLRMGL
jgi:hypothetical protein